MHAYVRSMSTIGEYTMRMHRKHCIFIMRYWLLILTGRREKLMCFHDVSDKVIVRSPSTIDERL